ncbi:MAG: 16S rRNA m(2)G1207 methyltransferase [Sodalis sp. Fse]|nr:MAG: 16S rRNA m(2)G1207 methyltransferase [Sodalis sp. Fse]
MSALTPASEVILRHQNRFLDKCVLFAGDIQDLLPTLFYAREVRVHTAWFHREQVLAKVMGNKAVQFSLVADAVLTDGCDALIYYWPKNKPEALFQLTNLLSLLPMGCDVFVVGENHSGVRSAEQMLSQWCLLRKIDSARRCSLYHGQLMNRPLFNINDYWEEYQVDDVVVKTLPGVFSRDRLDNGSQLLLSTFEHPLNGDLADIGCGAGCLSAILAKDNSELALTLSDVHASALAASFATLAANNIQGKVLASDLYSAINDRFDIIVSNPPFHDGIQTNLKVVENLIRSALGYLHISGELRIVVNAFLPYSALLDLVFGNHQVLAQNNHFKVYQAIHLRTTPKKKLTNVSNVVHSYCHWVYS